MLTASLTAECFLTMKFGEQTIRWQVFDTYRFLSYMAAQYIHGVSGEILEKPKARDFNATSLLLMMFLLFTLLYLIIQLKINLLILLKKPSRKKALLTLHVMTEMHFFTSEKPKKYHASSCQSVCDALTFLLDNIFIRFGTKLYK